MRPKISHQFMPTAKHCRVLIRDEHGPGGPRAARPGPTRPAGRAGPGRAVACRGPGRAVVWWPALFKIFGTTVKQIIFSINITIMCSKLYEAECDYNATKLSYATMQFKHSRLKEITTCLQQIWAIWITVSNRKKTIKELTGKCLPTKPTAARPTTATIIGVACKICNTNITNNS